MPTSPHNSRRRVRGFTLTEMLVVISIIILVLALALPSFRFMTGANDVENTANRLSAYIGNARQEAVANGKVAGVLFLLPPVGQGEQVSVATVIGTDPPPDIAGMPVDPDTDVYLDVLDSVEVFDLPAGVMVQVVDAEYERDDDRDGMPDTADDRYIGYEDDYIDAEGTFNPKELSRRYGGVILFGPDGRLVSRTYAFRAYHFGDSDVGNAAFDPGFAEIDGITEIGMILFDLESNTREGQTSGAAFNVRGVVKDILPLAAAGGIRTRSGVGLVLFPAEPFFGQFSGDTALPDWQTGNTGAITGSDENEEERWIGPNAIPLLVNRYNGTLLRGE